MVIRENYFRDIPTHGIYPAISWGVEMHNNVFYKVGVFANRSPILSTVVVRTAHSIT